MIVQYGDLYPAFIHPETGVVVAGQHHQMHHDVWQDAVRMGRVGEGCSQMDVDFGWLHEPTGTFLTLDDIRDPSPVVEIEKECRVQVYEG